MSNSIGHKHKPEDYKAIAWWGYSLGSMSYYVEAQQAKAAKTQQPLDVIYEQFDSNGPTGVWSRIADCKWNAQEVFDGWLAGKHVQQVFTE
jgi:hypothetical protein